MSYRLPEAYLDPTPGRRRNPAAFVGSLTMIARAQNCLPPTIPVRIRALAPTEYTNAAAARESRGEWSQEHSASLTFK
jgi:hypothetical protein